MLLQQRLQVGPVHVELAREFRHFACLFLQALFQKLALRRVAGGLLGIREGQLLLDLLALLRLRFRHIRADGFRQVLEIGGIAGQAGEAENDIAQFADVARIGVVEQEGAQARG